MGLNYVNYGLKKIEETRVNKNFTIENTPAQIAITTSTPAF
jgi:hypothetical protein